MFKKRRYKKGDLVIVTEYLEGSSTQRNYSLDSAGRMKTMAGKTFEVRKCDGDVVTLLYEGPLGRNRTFSFDIKDVHGVDESCELPEHNFSFDINQLFV